MVILANTPFDNRYVQVCFEIYLVEIGHLAQILQEISLRLYLRETFKNVLKSQADFPHIFLYQ